ncbi:MAG: hypothetical protein IT444_04995 [Phycisphaeraceae bacterium]|nr:hypothetical protein [Phycisphaeraceae bacterium]
MRKNSIVVGLRALKKVVGSHKPAAGGNQKIPPAIKLIPPTRLSLRRSRDLFATGNAVNHDFSATLQT